MNDLEVLNKSTKVAVIGMNADPKKYANKIYRKLKEHDKTVFGVNPNYSEIAGDPIYATINDIDDTVDLVVMVVAPKHGINMLEDIKAKGITKLWLQPGTISDELIAKAHELKLETIESCVLKVYYDNAQ